MTIPRVLFLDIETAPIIAYVWGLWENNVGLNQIRTDWYVLSWAAKWLDSNEVMQMDMRRDPASNDDSKILKRMWKLLDEADIVVTQNGRAFDVKKLNARFLEHGFKPYSPFKQIDTKLIAKKYFGFPSNKLEYMAKKLNLKNQKLTKREFNGFELWVGCLAGKRAAWNEMRDYNIQDVVVLEELWQRMEPWANSINFSLWSPSEPHICSCGSRELQCRGYAYTSAGRFHRYQCKKCGTWSRGKRNLLSKEEKAELVTKEVR